MYNISVLWYFLSHRKIIHISHCFLDLSHLSWKSVWRGRCDTGYWNTWDGTERDLSVSTGGVHWMLMSAESCPHAEPHIMDWTPAFFTSKTLTKVGFFYPKLDTFLWRYILFFSCLENKLSEEAVGILVPGGMCVFAGLLCCWKLLLKVEQMKSWLNTCAMCHSQLHWGQDKHDSNLGLWADNTLLNTSSAGIWFSFSFRAQQCILCS